MIIRTNDIDKLTAKIGAFGKSINDIVDANSKRNLDIKNLMSQEDIDEKIAKQKSRKYLELYIQTK